MFSLLTAAVILAVIFFAVVVGRFILAQFAPDNDGRTGYTDYRIVAANTAEQTRREYARKVQTRR